ncbi:MAG: divergent PAP2 family protein [Lachnospiraceae bacterium]|nr:divergent PAP2 family protein [Lachnospiraceae bacterium]
MNNHFYDLIHNAALLSAVSGWLVAQISKTILHTIVSRKFDAERLVGTGGMPSSHSATVCGLATGVFLSSGAGSVEFAVAAALAIIVMYDALGIRRQAGEQAKVLNEMIEVFSNMGKDISPEDRLKEFVGHTPFQVFVGALIGVGMGILMYNVVIPMF